MCLQVIKGRPTKETEEIEIQLSFATRGDFEKNGLRNTVMTECIQKDLHWHC